MKRPVAIVIEDQASLSVLYSDALRLVGYDVTVIRHGFDAINILEVTEESPTLIVLDINLPFASGADILKYIRKREVLAHVPVMVVTANSVMADKIQSRLTDRDYLFIKPLSMRTLQDIAKELRPERPKTGQLNTPTELEASLPDEIEAEVNEDATNNDPETEI